MILFFAGAGTSERIRPEDILKGDIHCGTLLSFWEINTQQKSEPARRFRKIKKHRAVEKLR